VSDEAVKLISRFSEFGLYAMVLEGRLYSAPMLEEGSSESAAAESHTPLPACGV